MKDDQASEERLMGELDRMYRNVADIESGQTPAEHHHNPYEHEPISDSEAATHAKIIPFPEHRIHLPPGEPSDVQEEEPKQQRKPSDRPYLIVASFPLIFLVFILVTISFKGMIAPPRSEKGDPDQLTFPIRSTASPRVQEEQDVPQASRKDNKKQKPYRIKPLSPVRHLSRKNIMLYKSGRFVIGKMLPSELMLFGRKTLNLIG